MKLGLSRGHWSDIVNGRHPYPSPKTRQRLLEELGVLFEDLFEIEPGPGLPDAGFQDAILARYIVDHELGQGGMGTVYVARDRRLGRLVAIKVISPEAVGGIGTRQFLREVRYVAGLDHPHILPLYEAGQAAGFPYYVMPYVRGGALRDRLVHEQRLSLDSALGIISGMSAGLAHAHASHVLHCDVKPENVLLTGDHAYVADFGIARAIHAEALAWGRTSPLDSSAGTPAYVSPEQAAGERDLDARSDVYSVGCVVFEMLAGRPPFTGRSTLDTVSRRFYEPPPDVRAFAPEVPEGVAAVIERAMAVERRHRYGGVAEFSSALEREARRRLPRFVANTWVALARASDVTRRRMHRTPLAAIGGAALSVRDDLRYALRLIRRRRRLTFLMIATMALGIGAATAIFSLVDGVLLKPLPYRDPEQLVTLWRTSSSWRADPVLNPSWDRLSHSLPDYLGWAAAQRSFVGVAASTSRTAILDGEEGAEVAQAGSATASLASLLGVRTIIGRWFSPGEDGRAAARVAVLSFEAWRTRYGGDSTVLGRTATLDGVPFEIVGVLPPRGMDLPWQRNPALFWTPAGTDSFDLARGNRNYAVTARLARGVSRETAIAEAVALLTPPVGGGDTIGVRAESVQAAATRSVRRPLLLLLWASLLLLVMAAVNVATLLVGEADGRDAETAARLTLGAGATRVVRQVFVENGVAAGCGAALGVVLASLAVRILVAAAPEGIPRITTAHVDGRAIGFASLVTAATTALFSLAPVIALLRTPPAAVLQAHSSRLARQRGIVQRAGVFTQSAIVVVLLVGATLLVRTHQSLRSVDLGFRADAVLSVSLRLPRDRYSNDGARRAVYDELVRQAGALPGVATAAFAVGVPFQGGNFGTTIQVAGSASPAAAEGINGGGRVVSDRYFEVLGIPLRAGRLFGATENGPGTAVIVNETFARRFWPHASALGQRIRVDGVWRDVVGVVGDVRHHALDEDSVAAFYLPATQTQRWPGALLLRARGDPVSLIPAVRRLVAQTDPGIAINRADRLSDAVDRTLVAERYRTTLIGFFAVAAALLAAVGVYGVANGMVVRRARELAIRAALGAAPRAVHGLVVSHMLVFAGGGAVAGALLALTATHALRPFLFGVTPADTPSYVAVLALVAVTAVAAAWLPARRATRIDLMRTLRAD